MLNLIVFLLVGTKYILSAHVCLEPHMALHEVTSPKNGGRKTELVCG